MKILILLISAALYAALITGMALIFGGSIRALAERLKMMRGLSARNRMKKENAFFDHIDRVLEVSLKGKISAKLFVSFCLLIFFAVACVALRSFSFSSSLAVAAVCAVFPYIFLRMRLENIRAKTSEEGEGFVAALLSSYRICDCNIYPCLEKMGEERGGFKRSVSLLMDLLYRLRGSGGEAEAREATDAFAFAINTNWSRMLAYDLYIAAVRGANISPALEDILLQLREARLLQEERKRMNGEALRMLMFLVPLLYAFTLFVSVKYLGVPLSDFFRNQFFTQEGFTLFMLTTFLFAGNLLLLELANNRRFDF